MKKNKLFLLGLFVVFAAVLSLSLVSNTLAKYTSSDNGSDSARVAKWGVVVNVTGDEAFGQKYDNAISASGTKVVSNNVDNVVAPDTNGTLGSFNISGTPEVMVDVEVALTITLTGWEIRLNDTDSDGDIDEDDDAEFYCPLVISDGTTTLNGTTYDSAAAFKAAIEALVDYTGNDLAANSNLARSVTLTWSWSYTGDDVKDTALGNLSTAPSITAAWSASVTQVD